MIAKLSNEFLCQLYTVTVDVQLDRQTDGQTDIGEQTSECCDFGVSPKKIRN